MSGVKMQLTAGFFVLLRMQIEVGGGGGQIVNVYEESNFLAEKKFW